MAQKRVCLIQFSQTYQLELSILSILFLHSFFLLKGELEN